MRKKKRKRNKNDFCLRMASRRVCGGKLTPQTQQTITGPDERQRVIWNEKELDFTVCFVDDSS